MEYLLISLRHKHRQVIHHQITLPLVIIAKSKCSPRHILQGVEESTWRISSCSHRIAVSQVISAKKLLRSYHPSITSYHYKGVINSKWCKNTLGLEYQLLRWIIVRMHSRLKIYAKPADSLALATWMVFDLQINLIIMITNNNIFFSIFLNSRSIWWSWR